MRHPRGNSRLSHGGSAQTNPLALRSPVPCGPPTQLARWAVGTHQRRYSVSEPDAPVDRRDFLRGSLAAAGAMAMPGALPSAAECSSRAPDGRTEVQPVLERIRRRLAAARDRRRRGQLGRVDRRQRGPHRRAGRQEPRGSIEYVGAPEVIDTVRGCSTTRTRSTT